MKFIFSKVKNSYVIILEYLRKLFSKFNNSEDNSPALRFDITDQRASDHIKALLDSDKPCMIARFGSGELSVVVVTYFHRNFSLLKNSIEYIKGKRYKFWLSQYIINGITINGGFFPADKSLIFNYGDLILKDLDKIDVLGSWVDYEYHVSHLFTNAKLVRLGDLEPYYFQHPWSIALKGKTVLVIHPFEDSIKLQYAKRELLFGNKDILPEFNLKTIKAVQSLAHNKVPFNNWFEAFQSMCKQIDEIDFDIALIGAGAYGMPLATYVKKRGKKAVHLGGALQILFGIKGKRWENSPFFKTLINEHWVKPLPHEVPPKAQEVEDACYW